MNEARVESGYIFVKMKRMKFWLCIFFFGFAANFFPAFFPGRLHTFGGDICGLPFHGGALLDASLLGFDIKSPVIGRPNGKKHGGSAVVMTAGGRSATH